MLLVTQRCLARLNALQGLSCARFLAINPRSCKLQGTFRRRDISLATSRHRVVTRSLLRSHVSLGRCVKLLANHEYLRYPVLAHYYDSCSSWHRRARVPNLKAHFCNRHAASFPRRNHRPCHVASIRAAESRGESKVVGALTIQNVLREERPDLLKALYGMFHLDWRGEEAEGEQPWFALPMFSSRGQKVTARLVSLSYYECAVDKEDPHLTRSKL